MSEAVKHVRWYKRATVWRRIASDGGAFVVGMNAAVLSWKHIVDTAIRYGHETTPFAYLYPLSIDGMMVVGVVKAADDRASGRKVRGWARVATWVGGIMSISAQIMSALPYAIAAAVASVPSIALIIVVEVMARRGKLLREGERRHWWQRAVTIESSAGEPVPASTDTSTEAVEPATDTPVAVTVSEPVAKLTGAQKSRKRRAPAQTTEHTRRQQRRAPAGRGYPGTVDVSVGEAVTMEPVAEADATVEAPEPVSTSDVDQPVVV